MSQRHLRGERTLARDQRQGRAALAEQLQCGRDRREHAGAQVQVSLIFREQDRQACFPALRHRPLEHAFFARAEQPADLLVGVRGSAEALARGAERGVAGRQRVGQRAVQIEDRAGQLHVDAGRRRSAPRLDPGLRPGQRGARALPVAAHLGPHLARGEAPVQLELGGARREERAEHADRAVVGSGRHRQHEGLDGVPPREADVVGRRVHRLDGGRVRRRRERAKLAAITGRFVSAKVGKSSDSIERLQPARDGGIVGVDARLAVGQVGLHEQRVARAGRAPQHPPVAGARGQRLAAVGAQADEGVLAGHEDGVGIDRWWRHVRSLLIRSRAPRPPARRCSRRPRRCRRGWRGPAPRRSGGCWSS